MRPPEKEDEPVPATVMLPVEAMVKRGVDAPFRIWNDSEAAPVLVEAWR